MRKVLIDCTQNIPCNPCVSACAQGAIVIEGGLCETPVVREEKCNGCGACVAACPNASAMLFTSAKVAHLALLPQGQPERMDRVLNMVAAMDAEDFGACSNHGECEAACPKGIKLENIASMNRDFIKASLTYRPEIGAGNAS